MYIYYSIDNFLYTITMKKELTQWSHFLLFSLLIFIWSCGTNSTSNTSSENQQNIETPYPTLGNIERLDSALNEMLAPNANIEVLAEGFDWSEGPVWVPEHDFLLFSDIPPNRIYQWKEGDSISLYLTPSGYTGSENLEGEPGSNGLLLDGEGRLVLCQHGDRRMARMNAPLDNPQPKFITLVDRYEGKRLNSPNDATYHSSGDLYFTDPPYGLPQNVDDPAKELEFQGVYRLSADSTLTLLTQELSRPNGIAFSPDEKTLYVANSDPERAIWMAYDVSAEGTIENERVFYDATALVGQEKGLPDGLKTDLQGNLFATGPGGVWIFSPEGTVLGKIKTGQATANCAFNEDYSVLYITADMYLLRVALHQMPQ